MVVSVRRLLVVAALTRGAYLLAVLALSSRLPSYDTSSALLSDVCADDWPQRQAVADRARPLVVWDAVYFHRVAHCGYEFEQFHAFFPFLPGLLEGTNAFLIAGLAITNAAFLLSVFLFARVGQAVTKDDRLSATAVLLFIFNPASVFHSMLYTESAFGCMCLLGLYCLYCQRAVWLSSLPFAVSSGIRSNGILNAGFLLHENARRAIACWRSEPLWALVLLLRGAITAAVVLAPYAVFQYFGYQRYCKRYSGPPRPWCEATVPNLYGYVQSHYWGVGLLRYYELKQVPNFLLAAPALALSLWGCCSYARARPRAFATGCLLQPVQLEQLWLRLAALGPSTARQRRRHGGSEQPSNQPQLQLGSDAAKGLGESSTGHHNGGTAGFKEALASSSTESAGAGGTSSAAAGAASAPLARVRVAGVHQQQQPSTSRAVDATYGPALFVGTAHGQHGVSRGFYSPTVGVFIYHWAFMALFAALVMHVQVATRFLSGCLPLYWWAAHLVLHGRHAQLLWLYFFAFAGIGAVLHPLFYPWT